MNYPKVLILNQPFNNNTGGGITISNLFAEWPRDLLAVVCQSYLLNNLNSDMCSNYYQLGRDEHKFIFPLNLIKRKHYSGPLITSGINKEYAAIPKSKLRNRLIFDYFNPILKFSGLANNISKTKLSTKLCAWLDEFSPDIIYAQASSRESIIFILLVHSYLQKPLVFHMMDDWLSLMRGHGPMKFYWRKIIDREFRTLLKRATLLMSISHAMADEYEKRYSKKFITFHNPIDLDFWKKYQKSKYEINDSPTILYAGRIGLGVHSSLEKIAKVVQSINKEYNLKVKFILQTKEKPSWLQKYNSVQHVNPVDYIDLPKYFSSADILIIPYDFTQESVQYIQFSMPTKAPEYMISGTPIIVFAPESTAIVKYAKKYEWAEIVTSSNDLELSSAIRQLLENKNLREKLGKNAINIAEENHSSTNVSRNFISMLSRIIPTT
jgi:glycosyltransferase involved in cell wall biosynthesis